LVVELYFAAAARCNDNLVVDQASSTELYWRSRILATSVQNQRFRRDNIFMLGYFRRLLRAVCLPPPPLKSTSTNGLDVKNGRVGLDLSGVLDIGAKSGSIHTLTIMA
jgi:hypothetical protein